MYKERKETTHERVGERKTYINNIEEKKVQCMSINGHKTSCTRTMYLRKKRKDTQYSHYIPQKKKNNNTPHNIMNQKLTLPLRVTTFISKTTSPFCHK